MAVYFFYKGWDIYNIIRANIINAFGVLSYFLKYLSHRDFLFNNTIFFHGTYCPVY